MFRKKKLIWFESDPVVTGAEHARARGALADPAHRTVARSPYYGPVTIPGDADLDDPSVGRAGCR